MSNKDNPAWMQELFDKQFPNWKDCVDGHKGPEVKSREQELADDRYYDIEVTRCGHCGIPLNSEYV